MLLRRSHYLRNGKIHSKRTLFSLSIRQTTLAHFNTHTYTDARQHLAENFREANPPSTCAIFAMRSQQPASCPAAPSSTHNTHIPRQHTEREKRHQHFPFPLHQLPTRRTPLCDVDEGAYSTFTRNNNRCQSFCLFFLLDVILLPAHLGRMGRKVVEFSPPTIRIRTALHTLLSLGY